MFLVWEGSQCRCLSTVTTVEQEHSSCGFCVVCCVWHSVRICSGLEPFLQLWSKQQW